MKVTISHDNITVEDGITAGLVIGHPNSFQQHVESIKQLVTKVWQADRGQKLTFQVIEPVPEVWEEDNLPTEPPVIKEPENDDPEENGLSEDAHAPIKEEDSNGAVDLDATVADDTEPKK